MQWLVSGVKDMDITTSDNFIKDAIIDHVLKDIGIELKDLKSLDAHGWEMFELLCISKQRDIQGIN